jgi:hypothetical protein
MQLHHDQAVTARGRALLAALAFLGLTCAASAQMLNVTDISRLVGTSSATIGTGAVLLVPQAVGGGSLNAASYPGVPGQWSTAFIANASSTATISCGYSPGVTLNGPDSFTIPPGQSLNWDLTYPPPRNLGIWCIASAAATPIHVSVGAL